MRDGCRTVMIRAGITPRIITDNTPIQSLIVDTLGWEWVKANLVTGPVADGDATFAVSIAESDDAGMAGATPCPDSGLVSQTNGIAPELAASFPVAASGNVRKIEILPGLRYRQLTLTPVGNTGNAFVAQAWHLGVPGHGSVVQLAA